MHRIHTLYNDTLVQQYSKQTLH